MCVALAAQVTRQLFIFAGKRGREYRNDLLAYKIDTNRFVEIASDCSRFGGPDCGLTGRAVIDAAKREIYVLSVRACWHPFVFILYLFVRAWMRVHQG